jgi:HK97 family phage major capsid protein
MRITKKARAYARRNLGVAAGASRRVVRHAIGAALLSGKMDSNDLAALTDIVDGSASVTRKHHRPARSKGASIYRVRDAAEQYSTKRHTGRHARTGERVVYNGKAVETPSQLDYAKSAAWLRLLARRAGIPMPTTDHEKALVAEMFQNDQFIYAPSETETQIIRGTKAQDLFNDTTSGGQYLDPLWWDSNIITYPLLNGELFPYVDLVDMPRGTLINTAAVSNPTATWMASESTGMTAFDCTSLVSQIVDNVRPVTIAIKWGRDLAADALVNIGETLSQLLGQRLTAELDKVIAVGDGSVQPLGIVNTSSPVAVLSDNSTGGPPTVGDYEALYFNVPKQYRNLPAMNMAFVGSDVSYRRARGIAVGPADERRVLGMDEQDYSVLGTPFRVSNDMVNNKVAALPLKKYRMWRRLGQEMTFTIEGQTLVLANEALLVMRGRYAGRVVDANAVTLISDFPT